MIIRLFGKRNNLGIGTHYGCFADALHQIWSGTIQEVDIENQSDLQKAAAHSQPDDINISFVSMNLEDHFRGHNIQWIVFESTVIPELLLSTLRAAQWVWVPSTWGRDVLLANHIDTGKIDIVQEGVDPNRFQPCDLRGARPFRFLTVGKTEPRKSLVEIMQAFAHTYGHDSTAELVIKTDHFWQAESKRQTIQQVANSLSGGIRVEWGKWSQQRMCDLYHDCDVFVFASKGEGWGLPLIEALASGMPVLSTHHSAQADYLAHCGSSVIAIDYDMVPVDCEDYRLFYNMHGQDMGEWAQPRVSSIAQGMREARQNYHSLKSQALANSRIIRAGWNWRASAARALQVLRERGLLSG